MHPWGVISFHPTIIHWVETAQPNNLTSGSHDDQRTALPTESRYYLRTVQPPSHSLACAGCCLFAVWRICIVFSDGTSLPITPNLRPLVPRVLHEKEEFPGTRPQGRPYCWEQEASFSSVFSCFLCAMSPGQMLPNCCNQPCNQTLPKCSWLSETRRNTLTLSCLLSAVCTCLRRRKFAISLYYRVEQEKYEGLQEKKPHGISRYPCLASHNVSDEPLDKKSKQGDP